MPAPSEDPADRFPAWLSDEQYAINTFDADAIGFVLALCAIRPLFFSPLNVSNSSVKASSSFVLIRDRFSLV